MKNNIETQKVILTFGQLKKLVSESEVSSDNKFKIGCKYRWWCKIWELSGQEYIVVDIAPDRSYILIVPNNGNLSAEKYKIVDDGEGGEKIIDHSQPYVWKVSRASKGGEYVGVPDGWFDAAEARRSAGASAATNTKRIKSTLRKIAEKITPEHIYELWAKSFRNPSHSYEELIEMYRKMGRDAKVKISGEPIKVRGPKTAHGKTVFGIMIGLGDGKFTDYLGYDGEQFYYRWGGCDDLTDEEIRNILADVKYKPLKTV